VVVIENKVDTSDSPNQLARYRTIAEETFRERKRHFVYLTPFGSDPEDQEQSNVWINYSYVQVADILERILSLYHESFADKVRHYLRDYLTTIKRELLMNDDLNDLAVKVYLTHRAAFDFIFENRPDPASQLYPYFRQALLDAGFAIGSRNKGYVRFSSDRLLQNLAKSGQGWPDREQFLLEIDYYWNKRNAVMKAVISPGDNALRERLLDAAKELPFYRKPTGEQWLVFFIKRFPFVAADIANEEEPEIRRRVAKVVSDAKEDAEKILRALEKVVMPPREQ